MINVLPRIFFVLCLMNSTVGEICDHLCRCNTTDKVVDCSHSGITTFQSKYVLGNVTEYTSVDLCYNEISTFSSGGFRQSTQIRHLSLCSCGIENIDSNKLYFLDQLQTLNLNRNKLTSLASGTFENTPSLVHLDLAHNSIAFIGNGTFSGLGKLQTLRLSYNKIALFSSNTFIDLASLQTLELNNNYISNLATAFSHLQSLESLRLSHNFVRFIASQTFNSLAKLSLLDLSYNALEHINEETFCTVSGLVLTQLYINVNKLTSVSFVKCLPTLTTLDLSENLLTVVNASTFTGLVNLKELRMQSMPKLTAIQQQAFASLRSINRLYVSQCLRLTVIDAPLFASRQNLTEINFSHNRLESLPENVFGNATVQHVNVSNNPWSCWCDVVWMVKAVPSSPLYMDVVCESPQHLAGQLLSEAAPHLSQHCASINSPGSSTNAGLVVAVCSSLAAVLIAAVVLFTLLWLCRPAPREYPTKKRRGNHRLSRAQQQRLDRVNKNWLLTEGPDTETTEVEMEEETDEHISRGASADDNDNKMVLENGLDVVDLDLGRVDTECFTKTRVKGKRVRFA